uniref:Translocon-associated protein subunit beta n=1 Tax=Leersia perrieri TaxID=77586 RepID=A0A0D9WBR5_9ORYZ
MAPPQRSLPILLLLLLVATAAAAAAQDAPFVVAHKKVALSRPGPGVERLAITLDLYNQGSATAYDVSLNDDSWPPEAFQLVSGTTSKIVDKLDPSVQLPNSFYAQFCPCRLTILFLLASSGATASHNFVLETKVQGRFQGSPATVRYRVPTKAALQEAYSTPMFPLDILAERPPQQNKTFPDSYVSMCLLLVLVHDFGISNSCTSPFQAKRLVGKYGSLVSVVSFVGVFIYLVASPSKSSAAKGSKKRR